MQAIRILVVAGVLLGIGIGLVTFKTIKDLQDANAELQIQNERLSAQATRLRERLRVEDVPAALIGTLVNGCKQEDCLFRLGDGHNSYVVGTGVLTGFYRPVERSAWGETKDCDTLVITGGTPEIRRNYSSYLERGNSINSLDAAERIQANLDLATLTEAEQKRILDSSLDAPVELSVFVPLPGGKDAAVCHSMIEILSVK